MTHRPDIWGDGVLFAFSGIDGQTCWEHSLVGSTRVDPPGIVFPFQKALLNLTEGAHLGEVRLAAGDAADLDLVAGDGRVSRLRLVYLDSGCLVGEGGAALAPALKSTVESSACRPANMALAVRRAEGRVRFALALSTCCCRAEARERAEAALDADLDAAWAARVAFFDRLPPPVESEARLARLYAKACAVLKVNAMTAEGRIAHRWTTPDRWPHRDMWLWDSAFHAPAYAHLDPAWGQDALLAVLDMQHPDGFVAHQMRPHWTSGITQPPVLAWACWEVYRITGDRAFLEAVYAPLCRYLEWDRRHRDWNGNGLLGWQIDGSRLCRSGESGMDNSPRFDPDGPWDNVDFCAYAVSDMRCLAQIGRELGRAGEAAAWDTRAAEMGAQVNALLWDEETGFYYDRHVDGGLLRLRCNAGFLPLFAGVPSKTQAARLVEHLIDPASFWTPVPVPTVALNDPAYQADLWRGPTWININNLIRLGLLRYGYADLAGEIRRRTLDEIARWYERLGCLFEYYDCMGETPPPQLDRKGAPGSRGGTGFGVIADYNWTAAWTVWMLLENDG